MHELIEKRRSIRKYKPDIPVTKEQLNQLLGAAMLAPSARNTRPWEFIVVTKREMLDKIVEVHPHTKMLGTATAAIIVVALPDKKDTVDFSPQDCSAVTQNILLEAVNLGLGSCWCGVYPNEERVSAFRELFGLAESKVPFCVIAVGTPDENPSQRGSFEEARVRYIE